VASRVYHSPQVRSSIAVIFSDTSRSVPVSRPRVLFQETAGFSGIALEDSGNHTIIESSSLRLPYPIGRDAMPDPHPSSQEIVKIPESLRQQIEAFRRSLWRIKIIESIAAGLIGVLVSFLLVYGLDRVIPTPGWARLVILLGGAALFAGFAPYWLHRWVWGHRREAQLARLIARRYPGLGDRLLGVIELQHQTGTAETLSPRLRQAAMEAVAAETGHRPLGNAMPPSRYRMAALAALVLLIAAAAAFMATPQAGLNALQRWLMPLSDTERYTFTRLDGAPSEIVVPYGEAFDLSLKLSEGSAQRPVTATGRFGLQVPIETKLSGGDRYHFTFPGQQAPGMLVFRVGDLRHLVQVTPMQRPISERVSVKLTPPEYLQIPERNVELMSGIVSAVEGSTVSIELTANRPLESATFGPTRILATPASEEEENSAALVTRVPENGVLGVEGRTATTPEFLIGSDSVEIPFKWVDEYGLAGGTGFNLRVDAQGDTPPTCYIQGIERQVVILPDETLDFEVLGEDDFGVRAVGLEWSGEFTRPSEGNPAKGEMRIAAGGPERRRLLNEAVFSPAAFGIEPQKIELRAWAEDYHPTHGRTYSQVVTVYILTRDEHAQMLKNRFDSNIAEFEDLARQELQLYEENLRLERLDGEQLQDEENRERIAAQEQAEAENTRRMEELTEHMEELMKDAVRNGDVDKDTMRKMAEALKSMQELAREEMPGVRDKLADAQQPSNTPEKTEEDMSDAVSQQAEVLEKMNEAIEKASDANRQFEAGTFVARLKKAASEQSGIAASLTNMFDDILGMNARDLDPADARRINEAAGQQSTTASDVRWIQEDLASYFARTSDASFKEIYDEMRTSGINVGLDDVRTQLLTNHSFIATEGSRKWADALTEWAARLEGAMDEAAGGGGGGGGPSPEDEDFEFMLRVMKMIQQQQDLRARTRALEQFKRSFANE